MMHDHLLLEHLSFMMLVVPTSWCNRKVLKRILNLTHNRSRHKQNLVRKQWKSTLGTRLGFCKCVRSRKGRDGGTNTLCFFLKHRHVYFWLENKNSSFFAPQPAFLHAEIAMKYSPYLSNNILTVTPKSRRLRQVYLDAYQYYPLEVYTWKYHRIVQHLHLALQRHVTTLPNPWNTVDTRTVTASQQLKIAQTVDTRAGYFTSRREIQYEHLEEPAISYLDSCSLIIVGTPFNIINA